MKKIINILLVFLLSIGVCCNFKVFAQEVDLPISKEEYNERMLKDLGLEQNPTLKDVDYVLKFIDSMGDVNSVQQDWIILNGKSDLISLTIYYQSALRNQQQNPNKKYNVGYSEIDGYIRSFTIDELEFTYPGVMPTETEFGIPLYSREDWNNYIKITSPTEVKGKDLITPIVRIAATNIILTENHPEWGLSVNGKILPSEITSIANSIKETAKYKVKYTMDNAYIRHITFEEITASTPTPVPSETEQEETPSNPTESTTETQNQDNNKQYVLDDEPNTGV